MAHTVKIDIGPYAIAATIAADGSGDFGIFDSAGNRLARVQVTPDDQVGQIDKDASASAIAARVKPPTPTPPASAAPDVTELANAAQPKTEVNGVSAEPSVTRRRKGKRDGVPAHQWLRRYVRDQPERWGVTREIVQAGKEAGYSDGAIRQAKAQAGLESADMEIAGRAFRVWRAK